VWHDERTKIDTNPPPPSTRAHVHILGGVKYTSSLATLTAIPDTFLAALLSGRYAVSMDEEGRIFIDRDGRHFGKWNALLCSLMLCCALWASNINIKGGRKF
jgi:hypothetical protein